MPPQGEIERCLVEEIQNWNHQNADPPKHLVEKCQDLPDLPKINKFLSYKIPCHH